MAKTTGRENSNDRSFGPGRGVSQGATPDARPNFQGARGTVNPAGIIRGSGGRRAPAAPSASPSGGPVATSIARPVTPDRDGPVKSTSTPTPANYGRAGAPASGAVPQSISAPGLRPGAPKNLTAPGADRRVPNPGIHGPGTVNPAGIIRGSGGQSAVNSSGARPANLQRPAPGIQPAPKPTPTPVPVAPPTSMMQSLPATRTTMGPIAPRQAPALGAKPQ